MQLFCELTSEQPGVVPMFGYIPKQGHLVIDEFQMVRIEAKTKLKFGEVSLPNGVTATMIVHNQEE